MAILGQAPQIMAQAGPVNTAVQPAAQQIAQPATSSISNVVNPQVPQTGLIGSEQALLGGQAAAMGSMAAGNTAATGYLNQAAGNQVVAPAQIASATMGQMSQPQATPNILGAQLNAPAGLTTAYTQGVNNSVGSAQFNQGVSGLGPYASQGGGAAKLQADLTGANGQQAQQEAYAQYQSSPAMQYQMDQMQKATERSAAARGGLLGGNVLQELQRNASGIASQDYQNQFNNMSQVTNAGLNAASQQAGLLGQQGSMLGNLEAQRMGNEANIYSQQLAGQTQLAGQQYQTESQKNIAQAQLQADQNAQNRGIEASMLGQQFQGDTSNAQLNAQLDAQRNSQNAQIKSDAYSQLAQLAQANGLNTAGLQTGTAQQLAAGRAQAGQAIANNANQAAANIANSLSQSGVAVSEAMSKDISAVTDMIYQSGMQDKIDSQQLAAMLANISTGQASGVLQANSDIGAAKAAGTMGVSNAIQGGLGMATSSGLLGAMK